MLAYNIVTHGGPHWEIYSDNVHHVGDIYYDEVEALWYHSSDPYEGEIDV